MNRHLEVPLSQIDLRGLENNFENWRKERLPSIAPDRAFERYCIEQILKDYELSDEEISSGHCGTQDDGGVDGFYFFAGKRLITEHVDVPDSASSATLIVIQATYSSKSFSETRMERFHSFARDLLDYHTPAHRLTNLDPSVRELIHNFRTKYESMLGVQHSLDVVFHYAAKTTVPASRNRKLDVLYKRLERYVKSQLTSAVVSWEPWDCSRLLKRFREEPEQRIPLEITKNFTTANKDVVCLTRLSHYFAFLTGPDGQLRSGILEPNVRDYQGKRNQVNQEIRKTLDKGPLKEFWWLNNGITILAEHCSVSGDRLVVTKPEIVNGLQTSHEVFSFFKDNPSRLNDDRSIVVRVIIPPDEKAASLITKATNFQTEVTGLSLHASEQVHFNIEDALKKYDLFYDRKKGKYKRLKKPVSQVVSVLEVARSVIAILLHRPNDARARPQTLLNDDDEYPKIFDGRFDPALYVACVSVDRQVAAFLSGYSRATSEERRDIKYYVDMWVACKVVGSATPTVDGLAQKLDDLSDLSPENRTSLK